MGFATKYEGTERIDLGDGYWVEVKKCLSWAESNEAEHAGLNFDMQPNMDDPKKTRTNIVIDPEAKSFEQVLASIVAWNLADDGPATPENPEGVRDAIPWPIERDRELEMAAKKLAGGRGEKWKSPLRKSLERMPRPAFDLIFAYVGKANEAPDRKEAAQFPSGNGSGHPNGALEPSDDQQVLSGSGLSLEAGDQDRPPAAA